MTYPTNGVRTIGWLTDGTTTYYCSDFSYDPGVAQRKDTTGGFASPGSVGSLAGNPKLSFTLIDPIGFLEEFGLIDNHITASLTMYSQSGALGANRGTGSVHTKYVVAHGMVALETVESQQNDIVKLRVTIYPYSTDGFTSPVAITEDVALPSFSPLGEVCTLGTGIVNGVSLVGITGFTINLNNVIDSKSTDGGVFPIFVGLVSHSPDITVTSINVGQLEGLFTQAAPVELSSGGVILTITQTVDNVAVSTAIKTFSMGVGQARLNPITYTQGGWASASITAEGKWDGTDAVISVA